MFTLAQLICVAIVMFILGVMSHAVVITWFDRVKDNAISRLKKEIEELKAKL